MNQQGPQQHELIRAFVEAVNRNEAVALVTVVKSETEQSPPLGAKLLVWEDGRGLGSLGSDFDALVLADAHRALAAGASQPFIYPKTTARTRRSESIATFEVYAEVVQPPTLLVIGGGHIGGYVAKLGKMVGFQVAVLDDRPDFANKERFPDADQIICEDYETALAKFPIDENTYIVVVTRGHKHDEVSVRAVVNSPATYIGMIGSRRRAGTVLRLIRDSGVALEALDRVRTPIGLDIHAETPEEIAVAIVAELIMTHRGGTGLPMSKVERTVILED